MNKKKNGGGKQAPFHLLEGIRQANEAELSLLLQAFARIQEAHHGIGSAAAHPMKKGMENIKLWATWQAQLGMESPQGLGSDIKKAVDAVDGMKIIMHKMSQATLYHCLIECASIQRRLITGKPYGPYTDASAEAFDLSSLLSKAIKGENGVRYTSYLPMNPTVVLCLCVYVKQNYRLVMTDLNDTLIEVCRWNTVVIPEITLYLEGEEES